jgi:hypothetical protein
MHRSSVDGWHGMIKSICMDQNRNPSKGTGIEAQTASTKRKKRLGSKNEKEMTSTVNRRLIPQENWQPDRSTRSGHCIHKMLVSVWIATIKTTHTLHSEQGELKAS